MRFFVLSILVSLIIWSSSAAANNSQPLNLDHFLEKASKESEDLRALELDIQALQLEIAGRDLELSPILDVEVLKFWDDRPSSSSDPKLSGKNIGLELSKPFVTGTALSLSSFVETAEYSTITNEENLVNWQLGVSQSLWQNSFGRQTSLRRERDRHEYESRLLGLLFDRQTLVIDFETLYWDITYGQEEVLIRRENFERSHRILEWIQDRFDRSAAEHVDLLQAQTLVASRELQLQAAEDNLKTLRSRLHEQLLMDADYTFDSEDLKKERDINALLTAADFAPTTPALIESLQAEAEAKRLKSQALLEADKLKPVLEVGYSYGRQGLSSSFSTARDDAFSSKNKYHQVGVVFSTPLDIFLINKTRKAFEISARAQNERAQRSQRQSVAQWSDLERTIGEQKKRVETALQLAKLQNEKSSEEHDRYEKGRTTAFQAITFEQEAAESDLLALQLMAQLRRSEAQARKFIQKSDLP